MERVILHSDLNAFYAAVECLYDPALNGKAMAVGGCVKERHGIILAKSEQAKRAGVRTAETIWQAKAKCPELIIVPPHFERYHALSRRVRGIYYRYTDIVEPLGLDECWLDVTGSRRILGSGEAIAHHIRRSIRQETGLTVSVGVSFNKILAKLGSDMKKPDAVTCIDRAGFRRRIAPLPTQALMGVGQSTASRLARMGIHTLGDLAGADRDMLLAALGVRGGQLWAYANGLDDAPVVSSLERPHPKSIGHGATLRRDIEDGAQAHRVLIALSQGVSTRLRESGLFAAGIQIAVKDSRLASRDFQRALEAPTQSHRALSDAAMALFTLRYDWHAPVRALTVRAVGLVTQGAPVQMDFFTDASRRRRREALEKAVEAIRGRYGQDAIVPALLLADDTLPRG
ncbi:MAG: DNA polymerase IV [Christensenellales bacterium]